MIKIKFVIIYIILMMPLFGISQKEDKMVKTDKEWRASLDEMSYQVLRNSYTERPYTGEYNLHFEKGSYSCKGCDQKLFESNNKYDSNCGWPSFDEAIPGTINYVKDYSHNMFRIEVKCSKIRTIEK